MKVNSAVVLLGIMGLAHWMSEQSDLFYPFSDRYWVLVGGALLIFLVGYGLAYLLVERHALWMLASRLASVRLDPAKSMRLYVSLFLAFTALTLLDRFLLFGPGFMAPDLVMQYRILLTQEGGANAIKGLSLGNFFIFLLPTFLLTSGARLSRSQAAALLALFLLNVYLSSARSALFLPLLIALYTWAVSQSVTLRFVLKAALAGAALFFGFQLIGELVGKSTDDLGFVVYLAAPLHAFDEALADPTLLRGYWLSFYPLQSLLAPIFGITPANDLPNVFTPLPANVYSIFGVFQNDFGETGLLIAFFFFGVLSGVLDKGYRRTASDCLRIYAALNMAILTLGVFYDYYTTSGVVWLTMILTPFFFGPVNAATRTSNDRMPVLKGA